MFNRKTLFIVGAGAGADFKLPVGPELARDIAQRTKLGIDHGRLTKATADMDLALSFFERQDRRDHDYVAAFNLIQNGILLANSIDDFLNIHEADQGAVNVGKAAIVRSIIAAERDSHLWVDPSNMYNKMDLERIVGSWLVKFMQVLGPGRKAAEVDNVLDDVSFIGFNYDRCIEQFLTHALSHLYGVPRAKATEIVNRANIIHPYGWVGPFERVPFGGQEHGRFDYLTLGQGVKTYTEQIEEESVITKMQTAIRDSRCIVFLGFAYHKQNMALLKPPKSQKTRQV
ncbi:MAG: hypothetical protein H0V72_13025 [Bradyrhizobium sp.]|nr:hypothetical protein [Bradyrhizobium sp.]